MAIAEKQRIYKMIKLKATLNASLEVRCRETMEIRKKNPG